MNRILVIGLMAAALAAPLAAQVEGPPERHRRQLEARIRGQFMDQLSQRLGLDEAQRRELDVVLEEGAESRRALAEQSRDLRRRLMAAVADQDAPESEFEALLEGFRELRELEWALQREEEEALAAVLTSRQLAIFLFMRMQFNDRVRGMRGPPGGRPGGGGGPPIP